MLRTRKRIALFAIPFLFSVLNANAGVTLLEKDDWKVTMSGFAELDMFNDTTRSLTEVVGNGPIDRSGASNGNGDNGRTQFSIRNSRLAFTVLAPPSGDWKTKGYLEFDLLGYDPSPSSTFATGGNANTETGYFENPTLRVRHAFLAAENNGWQILAGQTWTLFGWDPLYVLSTASVAPVSGTIYERTPQVTVTKAIQLSDENQLQGGVSITRPVDRDSEVPGLDLGLRLALGGRRSGFSAATGEVKVEPFSIAVSGTFREFVAETAGGSVGNTSSYMGSALAVNTLIPVIAADYEKDAGKSLTLTGEFTTGSGYGDEFPSWTGNLGQLVGNTTGGVVNNTNLDPGQGGYDSTGSFQLVHLQSWNAQLQYHLPSGWDSFITAGYGQVSSNNIGYLTPATGKIAYNLPSVAFANFFHDFSKQVRAAIEFGRFETHYTDGVVAQDNRSQVSSWFRF